MSFKEHSQSVAGNAEGQNFQGEVEKTTLFIENLFLNVVPIPTEPPVVRKEPTEKGIIFHCEDLFLHKQAENHNKNK